MKRRLQEEREIQTVADREGNHQGHHDSGRGKMDESHWLYRRLVELLEQRNCELKESTESMIEKLQGQVNGLEELASRLGDQGDQAAEDGEEARKYRLVAMWVAFFCGLMNVMSFLPKDTDKPIGLGCVLSALGVAATGIIVYSTLRFAPALLYLEIACCFAGGGLMWAPKHPSAAMALLGVSCFVVAVLVCTRMMVVKRIKE
jgi:hypothetical protein